MLPGVEPWARDSCLDLSVHLCGMQEAERANSDGGSDDSGWVTPEDQILSDPVMVWEQHKRVWVLSLELCVHVSL